MPGPYINTPQTNDASYLTNGLDRLGELSPEKSFSAPNQNRDLISQMRSVRQKGVSLRTPRPGTRDPLRALPNGNQAKAEFTPLMKSAARNNIARRLSTKKFGGPETPAYLRDGYTNGATPALPRMDENSNLQSENTSSSAGLAADNTPMPQHASSSAQSTPLAQLPTRNSGGVLNDGNMMTLREQEHIIDKIEKENFGLKMKIHFLEDALSKRGSEFNQAALKENTDLKVNRITMQRELHKFKKNITQAEKEAEMYRLQLEDYRERVRRKQADETVRIELEALRSELRGRDSEIEELQAQQQALHTKESEELEKLKDEISDLQAEIREKDRQIDDRDDNLDELKMKASKGSTVAAELEDELESAKQQVEELKDDLRKALDEAKEAKDDRDEAVDEKRKAEEDLDELRDEMANKSFTTKGLSRQLEEKANRLEDDFETLQEKYTQLQSELEEKSRQERELQERLRGIEKEGTSDLRNLRQSLDLAEQQRDTFERKWNNLNSQNESLQRDLHVKSDEKELLQARHDALTVESAQLQKELSRSRKLTEELEMAIDDERQRAAQNDDLLRTQYKQEIDLLNEQIDKLHREVNLKESDHAADLEEWEAQRKTLEASRDKAEEKALGLQRTVEKLQDSRGTASGHEATLQEALESEKQRHHQEEKVLSKQIEELNQDLSAKRLATESNRTELNNAKEELRISIREQAALQEKVAELEEEIEVLQADIEQEHEFAEQQQRKSREHADVQSQQTNEENQSLRKQVENVELELEEARRALTLAQSDKMEAEQKLEKTRKSEDDTFNDYQEKRELKRVKQRLEKEVERIKLERDSLAESNRVLEEEMNAEIERAAAEENRLAIELDAFRSKQFSGSETRNRELVASKNKISRLETRIKDLEEFLDNQSKVITSPEVDVSALKIDLAEARKSETAATKREADLKTTNRDLRMQLNELERDLHEAKLAQLKSRSPSGSPSGTPLTEKTRELTQLRQQLVDIRAELKEVHSQNRELKRSARHIPLEDNDQTDLLLKADATSTELQELGSKLLEREKIIRSLKIELQQTSEDRDAARKTSNELEKQYKRSKVRQSEFKTMRDEDDVHDLSMRLSVRENEARQMKNQLKMLREERSVANKKAEEVEDELEVLQGRYENMLEKLSSGKYSKGEVREKEIKGLIKEIMWLKAKCRREERLRKDLAWSKNYLEQGEAMRIQCNQIDLRILREMGVEADRKKYQKQLAPVQKLRAGVFAVIAAIRMSNMEEQWRGAKQIGEELKLQRAKQTKRSSWRVRDT